MSSNDDKPKPSRRSRKRLSITRFAWGMVGVGTLLAVLAGVTGSDSAFLWIDVGVCILIGVILFLVGLIGCRSRPGGDAPTVQLGRTAFIVAAVVAVFAPAVKALVEIGELGQIAQKERECKAPPVAPPAESSPS